MRAVIVGGPEYEALIRRRKALGLDRWDEVWDGVLHMSPSPSREHQRIFAELLGILLALAKETRRGAVFAQFNVADPERGLDDFRIPDLSFVRADRLAIAEEPFLRGGPDLVIEIESPGDETRQKFAFYGRVGVRDGIVIHRDTKAIELFVGKGGRLVPKAASPDPVRSEILDLTFERIEGENGPAIRVSAADRTWTI